jgi:glycosyltransferase involved in cell wall biosynthesis
MSSNFFASESSNAIPDGRKRFFSVVIPLYNKEKSITIALNSVLNQTHDAFEVIVIDDGSTDLSASAVAMLPDKRVRLIAQPNQGVSVARNVGVRNAQSDYIAFLDADDYWHPDFLETIDRLIDICPSAGLFATSYRREEKNGKIVTLKLEPNIAAMPPGKMRDYFHAATFGELPFIPSSTCISRWAFEGVGGFKPGVKVAEDWDMFARVALRYSIIFTPEPKILYRRAAENRATGRPLPLAPWVFREEARRLASSGKLPPATARDLIEHVARVELYTATTNLLNKNRHEVILFLRGIKTKAFARKKLIIAAFMWLPLPLRSAIIKAKNKH